MCRVGRWCRCWRGIRTRSFLVSSITRGIRLLRGRRIILVRFGGILRGGRSIDMDSHVVVDIVVLYLKLFLLIDDK